MINLKLDYIYINEGEEERQAQGEKEGAEEEEECAQEDEERWGCFPRGGEGGEGEEDKNNGWY